MGACTWQLYLALAELCTMQQEQPPSHGSRLWMYSPIRQGQQSGGTTRGDGTWGQGHRGFGLAGSGLSWGSYSFSPRA